MTRAGGRGPGAGRGCRRSPPAEAEGRSGATTGRGLTPGAQDSLRPWAGRGAEPPLFIRPEPEALGGLSAGTRAVGGGGVLGLQKGEVVGDAVDTGWGPWAAGGVSSAYRSLLWPRFRGPGFPCCFECREPMGRGLPPGNKIPVSAKGCKPKENAKGAGPPRQPEDGVRLGADPLHAAHTDLEPTAMPRLTSLVQKLAQPPGCLPPSPWQQPDEQPPSLIHQDKETLSAGHRLLGTD